MEAAPPTFAFVSESIHPVTAGADTTAMAAGVPGLPRAFIWRGEELGIAAVLRTWRESGRCQHGSDEHYLRKHWYEVKTTTGRVARIYFERQGRPPNRKLRWWLYSMGE